MHKERQLFDGANLRNNEEMSGLANRASLKLRIPNLLVDFLSLVIGRRESRAKRFTFCTSKRVLILAPGLFHDVCPISFRGIAQKLEVTSGESAAAHVVLVIAMEHDELV